MAMDAESLVYDYLVFVIFIIGSFVVPLWSKFRGPKENTKADYVFASAGSVSMAAMMLSIARGTLGVRSFLGYPSELFYRGSAMWETLYGMVCAYPIVCFVFVPVYFNLGITSVYQYLDLRFHSRLVRCLASGTYVIRQLLNLGVTVFTPCVALNTVIGVPYWASILSITVISIIFTIMGGLKAAILADVVQGLLMIAVSFAIIVQGSYEVGGFANSIKTTNERGRLEFFKFANDPTVRVDTLSAWLGQLFMSLSLFGCQQNFVQRYCSMGSQKKVTQTLMANIPVITVLFSLSWVAGIVIFATYADCDPLTVGYIKKIDEILPFFVEDKFNYMPGLLGLFMATLFNGALSLSVSNLNSLATVTWEDFLSPTPQFKGFTDQQQLFVIKVIGSLYGVIIMGISFGVGLLSGVIESSMLMTSATSGPLLGVFILAMLIPCANWKGAAMGMIVSHILTLWITFGSMTIDKPPITMLPLSTEGCMNDTFSRHIMLPGQQWPETIPLEVGYNKHVGNTTFLYNPILNATAATPNRHHDGGSLHSLYSVSYMYYSFIGTAITVIVGIVVSYLTANVKTDCYDEKLLHPAALKISKWFPGKPRRYMVRESRPSSTDTIQICTENNKHGGKSKKIAEDNPSFEMCSPIEQNISNGIKVSKKIANGKYPNSAPSESFKKINPDDIFVISN